MINTNNRAANWISEEEKQLCKSWLHVSQDPIFGMDRRSDSFYKALKEHYDASILDGYKVADRPWTSLKARWKSTIQPKVSKFCGYVAQVEQSSNNNCQNEAVKLKRAVDLYNSKEKKKFRLLRCYGILRHHPIWIEVSAPNVERAKKTPIAEAPAGGDVIDSAAVTSSDEDVSVVTRGIDASTDTSDLIPRGVDASTDTSDLNAFAGTSSVEASVDTSDADASTTRAETLMDDERPATRKRSTATNALSGSERNKMYKAISARQGEIMKIARANMNVMRRMEDMQWLKTRLYYDMDPEVRDYFQQKRRKVLARMIEDDKKEEEELLAFRSSVVVEDIPKLESEDVGEDSDND